MTNSNEQPRWRPGTTPRSVIRIDGKWFVWRSEHPLEERVIELTDDYRDENGDFIAPECLAPEPESDRLAP